LPFVSRGGLKLQAALERFAVIVRDAVCADIGASTGGFTDCLLQAGARKVYAVDVGYGQLHEKLRQDPRVISRERVNARYLDGSVLPEVVDVCVLDVSFISLTQVLPAVLPFLRPGGTLLALVKPQFEVGREGVGKGGVVRDGAVREAAIQAVCEFMERHGLRLTGRMDSPVPGPAGNVEALVAAIRA
jgi:23S rRNA (cytidine1920-2'-O)/16S rRNA (cytidine1409-2'-O)-methyltransferase